MNEYQVCIVGGGISGLHTAYELAKRRVRFILLEARERVGGRVDSPKASVDTDARFDLGPSWFWPGQRNIENLVNELGIGGSVFQQFAIGDGVYEPVGEAPQRGISNISMAGSYRLNGGLRTLTERLREKIIELASSDALALNQRVIKLESGDAGISALCACGESYRADKLVLALPPRVAINTIEFTPGLPAERVQELNAIATWMAGHAKTVVIYATPFWRRNGLSGDVISHRGPLSEIHDASPSEDIRVVDGSAALFGFFATPPAYRKTDKADIDQQIINQLVRIFGDEASAPKQILYKDWALDELVATALDQQIPNHHPGNYLSTAVEPGWNHRLSWSGTETAQSQYNGYIEGALIASRAVLSGL